MKRTIVLSKEDCYRSLPDFYFLIEERFSNVGCDIRPIFGEIDYRKISITKSVFDEIVRYYSEKEYITDAKIITTFILYGPKGNLPERESTPYMVCWKE